MTNAISPLCHPHQPWPCILPSLSPHLPMAPALAPAPKHHDLKQRDQRKEKPAQCPLPTAERCCGAAPPAPASPAPALGGACALSFKVNPTNFKTSLPEKPTGTARSQIRFPTAAGEPARLSASSPKALTGFTAFLHLSNLCCEHFCPHLFVLVFFQDSPNSPSGSDGTSVSSTFCPRAAVPARGQPGCSVMPPPPFSDNSVIALPRQQQDFGCLREHITYKARPPDYIHLQTGKLRHRMHVLEHRDRAQQGTSSRMSSLGQV